HRENRDELPGEIIIVMNVEHAADEPGAGPLSYRIAHNDQGENFSEGCGAEILGNDERDEHVVRAQREAENRGKGPHGGGGLWIGEKKYGCADQEIKNRHDEGFGEAVGDITDDNAAAQAGG